MSAPEDGVRYTLRQVCDAGFLGDDFTPDTLRRAIKAHGWPHKRLGRKYGLTKANIDAILARSDRDEAKQAGFRQSARRNRRAASAADSAVVTELKPRPEAARRSRRRAS
jgi:hypothetical protein